jgi:FkbM family methyltransferase
MQLPINIKKFSLIYMLIKKIYYLIKFFLKVINLFLFKLGYINKNKFIFPYIIKKNVEGVKFLFHIASQDSHLWYHIKSGGYSWPELAFIRDNLIKKNGIVIECGSHHGMTAIMLSSWVGSKGKVYAIEPSSFNYSVLLKNIKINNIKNIKPLKYAVGNKKEKVYFNESSDYSMGSSVSNKKKNSTLVQQITIDNLNLKNISLIKIDVQGYVYQSLAGMKKLISLEKPNLAIEIDSQSHINTFGNNFKKLFDIINHSDYDYYISFSSAKPKKINFKKIITTWYKVNGLNKDIHLFCINKKKVKKNNNVKLKKNNL